MTARRAARRPVALAWLVAACWLLPPAAGAQLSPVRCTTLPAEDVKYDGRSPRVMRDAVDGVAMLVVVPPGYAASSASYPVLYYLQAGINTVDCLLAQTDLVAFTGAQPPQRQAIVVLPDVTSGPVWERAANKAVAEDRFLSRLIPYVEQRYRARRGRAYRALWACRPGAWAL